MHIPENYTYVVVLNIRLLKYHTSKIFTLDKSLPIIVNHGIVRYWKVTYTVEARKPGHLGVFQKVPRFGSCPGFRADYTWKKTKVYVR